MQKVSLQCVDQKFDIGISIKKKNDVKTPTCLDQLILCTHVIVGIHVWLQFQPGISAAGGVRGAAGVEQSGAPAVAALVRLCPAVAALLRTHRRPQPRLGLQGESHQVSILFNYTRPTPKLSRPGRTHNIALRIAHRPVFGVSQETHAQNTCCETAFSL